MRRLVMPGVRLCAVAALVVTTGCGGRYRGAVRNQHAALYGCDRSAVDVRQVANRTFAAEGCGTRAVYICRRGAVCTQRGEAGGEAPRVAVGAEAPPPVAPPTPGPTEADEELAAIRRDARAPELGATRREAEILCEGQRGELAAMIGSDDAIALACRVGGVLLFRAHVSPTTQGIDEVDAYVEGGDLAAIRGAFEERWGPGSQVIAAGVRAWTWQVDGEVWAVRVYERGVRVSGAAR